MKNNVSNRILFLSLDSPWPTHSGAALRAYGLIRELSKYYHVDLIVLSRSTLTPNQVKVLNSVCKTVERARLRDVTWREKIFIALRMIRSRYPYHGALIDLSMANSPSLKKKVLEFPGIVITSTGSFGAMVHGRRAHNWILNQCDADVEFWRVYATQAQSRLVKVAARLNYVLARCHYPQIYKNVGRIISVCEEDRHHTLALTPNAVVDVVENGVDCNYYVPDRAERKDFLRLLFTGTSAARNMTALHGFVKEIWPSICHAMPNSQLLVAGDFSLKAQSKFSYHSNIRFTGRVADIRPFFNQSDIFIAPFQETHGSKLKIAEAMAMAMPVVTTPMGIRGFPLVDGESVSVAHSNQEFAAKVVELMSDPDRRTLLGNAAREVALKHIDWQVLGKRLHGIVEETFRSIKTRRNCELKNMDTNV